MSLVWADSNVFFIQRTLIILWDPDTTRSGLCLRTPTHPSSPEWPCVTAPSPHPAAQPCSDHINSLFRVQVICSCCLSRPATSPLPRPTLTPHLRCAPPVGCHPQLVYRQLLDISTHPQLGRCPQVMILFCRRSAASETCRTCCWRGTWHMTWMDLPLVWLTCSCKVWQQWRKVNGQMIGFPFLCWYCCGV